MLLEQGKPLPYRPGGSTRGDQPDQDGMKWIAELSTRGIQKPAILSTLTTTERTTLPDSPVTTKTVLKKRFADMREERIETVHTSQQERPVSAASAAANGRGLVEIVVGKPSIENEEFYSKN